MAPPFRPETATPGDARARGPGKPLRLAIVVRSLAPYRNHLYDGIGAELGGDAQVTIFTADAGSVANYQWEEDSLRLHHARVVCVPPFRGPFGRTWFNPRLWKDLSGFDPTHVWFHEYSPYVLLALAWGRLHRRRCFVSTEIGDRFRALYTTCYKGMQDFFKRRCNGVIAHSLDAYQSAGRLGVPAVLVPHAVNTAEFVPCPPASTGPEGKKVRVLQVGIISERKGIDYLLRALRRCVDTGTVPLELVLLGGGEHAWARELIHSLGLDGHVAIHPFAQQSRLVAEYHGADIFTLASREDTYAVVVHEAAACGLPLVISRYAGASETLVEADRNGFVVDPADTEAFSRALLRLAADPALRGKFGRRSRELAEIYSAQECARKAANWLRESA